MPTTMWRTSAMEIQDQTIGSRLGNWTKRASRRGLWVSQPSPTNQAFCSQHAAGERSAAPPSPSFCTCAPTAVRQCPLGSVLAGEQPYRSRSAAVSRSERSAQAAVARATDRGGQQTQGERGAGSTVQLLCRQSEQSLRLGPRGYGLSPCIYRMASEA